MNELLRQVLLDAKADLETRLYCYRINRKDSDSLAVPGEPNDYEDAIDFLDRLLNPYAELSKRMEICPDE